MKGTVSWGDPTAVETGRTRLPIQLKDNPANVRSVQLTAEYDTSDVTITDVEATLPRGWRALHNVEESTGTVRIALSGTKPVSAGRLATLVLETASGVGQVDLSGQATLYTAPEQSIGSVSLDRATRTFQVKKNYPNPFRKRTTIKYALPEQTTVQIAVYDVLGRRVRTLVDGEKEAGQHTVTLDATSLTSGTYFYRVRTQESTETGRMVIVQ